MEPVDEDTFALEGSAALTFTRDDEGTVTGVVLDSGRTTGVVFRQRLGGDSGHGEGGEATRHGTAGRKLNAKDNL